MASGTWRAPGMIDRAGERVSASQTEDNLLENLLLTVWYNWHSCQTSQYPFDPHAWLISHFKEWQSAATVRSEGPFLFLRVFDLPSFTSKIPKFLAIVAMVREESTVSQQGTVPISSRIDSKCSRIGWSRCWGACQIQFGMAIDLDRSNPQKTFFTAQHTVPILPARANHDQQRQQIKWRYKKNQAIKPSNPLLMSTPCGKFTQLELNHYNPWSGHLKSSNLDLWFQTKVSIWFQLNRISLTRLTLPQNPLLENLICRCWSWPHFPILHLCSGTGVK